MEYGRFGTSGLKISRLALGLGLRGQGDEAAAERLIRRAFDGGVSLFDCANVYGLNDDRQHAGRSEEILGRALKGKRHDVVITSKVFSPIGSGVNDRGASRFHIMREVERSLRRLAMDHVDVYLFHGWDDQTPLEEQFRAMDDLARQGKIRYVGVCNYQAWQVTRAMWVQDRIGAAPLITIQNPYSLINRALETEMFPMLRTLGVGAMAYAPLGTGLLSGVYAPGQAPPPDSLWGGSRREQFASTIAGRPSEVLALIRAIASRHGATPAQVALKWVMSQPEISCAISGADTDQQIDENLGAVDVALTDADMASLNAVSAGLSMFMDGPNFGPAGPANAAP